MEKLKIEYSEIVNKIYSQFYTIRNTNEKYKDMVFFVDDEQSFIKRGDTLNTKALYIVLKFGEATFNKVSSVIPLTFLVFGVGNDLELTREFLNDYVFKFNLSRENGIQFIFSLPYVLSNFNEVGYDFRAMFSISGSLLVGNNSSIYVENIIYTSKSGEKALIDIMDFSDDTTNSLNPQIYGNNFGRQKSYSTFQTYSFNISLYGVDNPLINDIMKSRFENRSSGNDDYVFSIKFNNGAGFDDWTFKLKNVQFIQKLGNIPVFSLSFSL